jgi:serine/threonine protein kinase
LDSPFNQNKKSLKIGPIIGSQAYMAPEVFEGIYPTKVDSWSCGVIMHLLYLSNNLFIESEDFLIL